MLKEVGESMKVWELLHLYASTPKKVEANVETRKLRSSGKYDCAQTCVR